MEKYFIARIRGNLHNKTVRDFFLSNFVSKQKMNYLVSNNATFINGEVATYDTVIKQNDYIMIDISKYESLNYKPINQKIDILYEDDYILVINKPSKMIVYSDDQNNTNTVANLIAGYFKQNDLDLTVRHCHRLDTDTTGCLLYAKDLITHSAISNMFEKNQIEKWYFAIVEGMLLKSGTINYAIGKNRHINGKMIAYKNGQPSLTTYEVIDHSNTATLVKAKIETGRTHQIRVHFSTILHPLYGDTLYGAITSSRVMLHCHSLKFVHPITGKKIEIKCNVPSDFRQILKSNDLSCK